MIDKRYLPIIIPCVNTHVYVIKISWGLDITKVLCKYLFYEIIWTAFKVSEYFFVCKS